MSDRGRVYCVQLEKNEFLITGLTQNKLIWPQGNADGAAAIRASDISRTHRERLVKHGFLQEVMKGWYIPTRPDEQPGDSTSWYASFWRFCKVYLEERFGKEWSLSPEQSLLLHSGNWTVLSL